MAKITKMFRSSFCKKWALISKCVDNTIDIFVSFFFRLFFVLKDIYQQRQQRHKKKSPIQMKSILFIDRIVCQNVYFWWTIAHVHVSQIITALSTLCLIFTKDERERLFHFHEEWERDRKWLAKKENYIS